jgi:hypothetical protein
MRAPPSHRRGDAAAPVLLLALGSALLSLACTRVSAVLILDARPSRAPDNRVAVDVQLEAVEQGGGGAGPYCVSVHWFNFGFDSNTEERATYEGELDSVEQCANDLSDGDQRTYRLVSNRTDLATGLPARVQVRQGHSFQTKEGVFAP